MPEIGKLPLLYLAKKIIAIIHIYNLALGDSDQGPAS